MQDDECRELVDIILGDWYAARKKDFNYHDLKKEIKTRGFHEYYDRYILSTTLTRLEKEKVLYRSSGFGAGIGKSNYSFIDHLPPGTRPPMRDERRGIRKYTPKVNPMCMREGIITILEVIKNTEGFGPIIRELEKKYSHEKEE